MATSRAFSGKLVVAGVVLLAAGGAFLLNVFTAGPPRDLQQILSPLPSVRGTPSGAVVITPSSAPATPGRSVEVNITTPCGFVTAVDFDGSFWNPGNGRSMASVGRSLSPPVDPASVTLQAEDSALLRTAGGQVIVLVRSGLDSLANPVC